MEKSNWKYLEDHAPIFLGSPYCVFGLTGACLSFFLDSLIRPNESFDLCVF